MQAPGEFILTGIPGRRVTPAVERRLRALRPAGIVLFRRNIGTPQEVLELTRALRRVLGRRCLVAIDQEGGRVARLRDGFTQWPTLRALGSLPGTRAAHEAAMALGRELAALGVDINFAPVLDVDSNPRNPVIGDRSFSSDPLRVGRLGRAYAEGLTAGGVLACGKHFPGHGDTDVDSHFGLPRVRARRATLEKRDWPPFRAAIRAEMPLLMSCHVVYDALDSDMPATFSPAILDGILRSELGFAGVLASDDLAMGALAGNGVGTRAVRAFAAGCDLLLACQKLSHGEAAARALAHHQRDSAGARARVRSSRARLRALHKALADVRRGRARTPLESILAENERLAARLQRRLEARTAAGASPRTSRARLRR